MILPNETTNDALARLGFVRVNVTHCGNPWCQRREIVRRSDGARVKGSCLWVVSQANEWIGRGCLMTEEESVT
jgi:hypothetical protein